MAKWIFEKNSKVYNINKYQSNKTQKDILIQNLTEEILKLEQKLSKEAKELFQTEVTGIKAAFSNDKSWLERLQKKLFRTKIENSAKWQRDHILQLYREKKNLQLQLDKLTGKFWRNRIRTWFTIAIFSVLLVLIVWVVFLGIMTALYLLPLWGSILIGYIFLKNRSPKLY